MASASSHTVSSISFHCPAPAQLTMTSGTPYSCRTRSARATTASPDEASHTSTAVPPPMLSATRWSAAAPRATSSTRYPRAERWRAASAPTPLDAPVIKAVFIMQLQTVMPTRDSADCVGVDGSLRSSAQMVTSWRCAVRRAERTRRARAERRDRGHCRPRLHGARRYATEATESTEPTNPRAAWSCEDLAVLI